MCWNCTVQTRLTIDMRGIILLTAILLVNDPEPSHSLGRFLCFNFYIKPCLNVRPLRNKDFICYSINLRFHNTIKVIMLYALLWFESFLCMPRFGVKEFSNFNVNSREQWLHCGGKKIEAIMNTQYQPDREPWFRVLIITWKKSKKTYLLNFPVQDNKKMKKWIKKIHF